MALTKPNFRIYLNSKDLGGHKHTVIAEEVGKKANRMWKRFTQHEPIPLARSSHSITVVGHTAYTFGGEHLPRTPIDSQIHAFDLTNGHWTIVNASGDAPHPRVAHAAAAIGETIYFFGGRSGIEMGEGSTNDLHSFDTATSQWARVPDKGTPPPPRSFHAMIAVGGSLYVFGGCGTAGRLNDLHRFDSETGRWEQLASSDAIMGRGGPGLVASASEDALFVIAGFAGRELNDVHRFDLGTRSWDCPGCCGGDAAAAASQLPPRSVFGVGAHAACAACPHGGHLVLFGGEVDPSDKGHAGAGHFSNDTFCFDTLKGGAGWHQLSPEGERPTPRGWFASCTSPRGLMVHGGNSPTNERLSDMYLLSLH